MGGRRTRDRHALCHHPRVPSDPAQSRRFEFPPLWSLPLLVIIGVFLVVVMLGAVAARFQDWRFVGVAADVLALGTALAAIAWLQKKADLYVRRKTVDRD